VNIWSAEGGGRQEKFEIRFFKVFLEFGRENFQRKFFFCMRFKQFKKSTKKFSKKLKKKSILRGYSTVF
jgi:hypothetical protein